MKCSLAMGPVLEEHRTRESKFKQKARGTRPRVRWPQFLTRWLIATAVGLLAVAGFARAQTQVASEAATSTDTGSELQEVVVTATRREENLERVPASIAAVSQTAIDDLGIKSITDLQGAVPSLTIQNNPPDADQGGNASLANFTIRGIVAQGGVAPTTGIYLDDVPLQKRNAVSTGNSNGTPTWPLFDLDRIEVLRGPQGTLYGGSAEGGAIRFITNQPSLTQDSGLVRAEVSTIENGGQNYEIGGAWGGPIVKDLLGIRVTAWDRYNGGWISLLDPYTPGEPVRYKDANNSNETAFRVSASLAPTQGLLLNLSLFNTKYAAEGGTNGSNYIQTQNGASTFSTPTTCFSGSIAPVPCSTPGAFVRTGQTYGPYTLGPNDSLDYFLTPSDTTLNVGTFTINYDLGGYSLKSITSHETDEIDSIIRTTFLAAFSQDGISLFRQYPQYPPVWPDENYRESTIQEFRLTSPTGTSFDWIAGLYYSDIANHTRNQYGLGPGTTLAGADQVTLASYGVANANTLLGLPLLPDGTIDHRNQHLEDYDYAAYADFTWHATDKLSVLAGVRYEEVKFNFETDYYGAITGVLVPTAANGGLSTGSEESRPVTPRAGVQYQWTPQAMTYVSVAKGYRPGGVNEEVVYDVCGPGLAAVGLTPNELPHTYDPDSLWSYEVGGKIRLLDRVQVNASVFRIDWNHVQTSYSVGGCPDVVSNGGAARSQGFDVETNAILVPGLTATASVSYTDAYYTQNATGPQPAFGSALLITDAGDRLPVPVWQGIATLKYERHLINDIRGYAVGTFQYTGSYQNSSGPGTAGYNPDNYYTYAARLINLRLGTLWHSWDTNFFINNLFLSRDALGTTGGREGCPPSEGAVCNTPTYYDPVRTLFTFQPRTFGIQVNRKF
jgi:iron complex outermembrane recepter protein